MQGVWSLAGATCYSGVVSHSEMGVQSQFIMYTQVLLRSLSHIKVIANSK